MVAKKKQKKQQQPTNKQKIRYLFEASVLDVELLGINEVEQLAVLFPGESETDR